MIRFIAAVDSNLGIANENGIPWKGQLPTDVAYYRAKIRSHNYLIGYGTYAQHTKPLPQTPTFVATIRAEQLRPGFKKVTDARKFLKEAKKDIWVGGGAALFADTLDFADELYLTRIAKDFHCTKFFPQFEDKFMLVSRSQGQEENGITFCFEVWRRLTNPMVKNPPRNH